MHNLSDEELDRLSREAAEVNQTPVSPAGWNMISTRLDQEMPVAVNDRTWYLRVFTDLLLLLTFAYFGFNQPSVSKEQMAGKSAPGSTTEITKSTEEMKTLPTENDKSVTNASKSANNQTGQEVIASENNVDKNSQKELTTPPALIIKTTQLRTNSAGKNKAANVISDRESDKRIIDDNKQPLVSTENKLIEGKPDDAVISISNNVNVKNNNGVSGDKNAAPVIIAGIHSDIKNESPASSNQKVPQETAVVKSAAPDSITNNSATKNVTSGSGKNKKAKSSSFDGMTANALQIGVTWSPDFSKVGSAKPVDHGQIVGITAGYQFNRRWSIQSGILYTNKFYTTEGGAYGKVPGYSSYDPYIKITKVNATCYMLDIPLNVRYNWLVRRKSRAFASAGFSSYLMKEEDLNYWYTYYNNPKYKEWTNEKNSNYWLAVANISAGFEQFITPAISIQAEPFFKFSLRDIGYGQVKIKSAGIFLGIKYTPPLHLSKK